MPTAGGGFEQAYNAQAGVDTETHLIVEQHVTDHSNDKQPYSRANLRDFPAHSSHSLATVDAHDNPPLSALAP